MATRLTQPIKTKGMNMAMTMLQMAGAPPAVDALAVLLGKAGAAGTPIVHVRHQSKGKAFNQSSAGYEIVKALTPRDGGTIIDKGMPSSFAGTDLASQLAAIGPMRRAATRLSPM